jgi:hypothetical protein
MVFAVNYQYQDCESAHVPDEPQYQPFKLLADFKSKVARPEGETSNSLFDELEKWNDFLKAHAPTYQDPSP